MSPLKKNNNRQKRGAVSTPAELYTVAFEIADIDEKK